MLVRAKKVVTLSVMALAAAVISLPVSASAATAPAVTVQSPVVQGLRVPVKMIFDGQGNSYVADQRVGGVVKFDVYGVQQMVIATAVSPAGLAFAQDGALLVAQSGYVARYDVATGVEVGRFGVGQLKSASGIAIDDETGYIYVSDAAQKQVFVFTASGAYSTSFGAGVLVSPAGVTFEKVAKQIVVADVFGNKVRFFDRNGNLVKTFGRSMGSATQITADAYGALQFLNPIAVAFEYTKAAPMAVSRMYVVDAYAGMVQVIDPAGAGSYLSDVGSAGTGLGQLMVPSDVVFDSLYNRLMVVNGFGNVAVFGIDGGKNPLDTTPPVFTVNQLPVDVIVGTVTVTGTVEAGASVVVTAGAASVGAVSVNGTNWSAVVSGLAYGKNDITVSAKDVAGNKAADAVVTVNYLTPAPVLAIAAPAVTNVAKVVVSGSVDAGSVVAVQNGAAPAVVATVSGDTWSCEVALVEGANSLSVSAQKAGSAKAVASAVVALDTRAPLLTVSALANGSNASDAVQNIAGTVADASSVAVTVNGVAAPLTGNAFSVPVTLLNGANTVVVAAVDAAGNTALDSRVINFVPGPAIAVQAPVDNAVVAVSQVQLTGTQNGAASVAVNGVPAILDAGVWSATVDLVSGVNTIEVVAKDANGAVSSAKRTITYDGVKPALAVVAPAQDAATKDPSFAITGTVADTTNVALSYDFNGKTVAVPVVNGVYSFNVEFAAEGAYPVVLTAKDSAGNASTVVRNLVYDVTPPVVTMGAANGVMPTKVSGTVESGSVVTVVDGATELKKADVVNGEWTADLAGIAYTPGNLGVIAADAAGNASKATLLYNFPDGTLNGDGKATVKDAMQAIKIVVNQSVPTAQELAHYDVGPLVAGKPNPNGKIEIVDAILILRKALGLKSW